MGKEEIVMDFIIIGLIVFYLSIGAGFMLADSNISLLIKKTKNFDFMYLLTWPKCFKRGK